MFQPANARNQSDGELNSHLMGSPLPGVEPWKDRESEDARRSALLESAFDSILIINQSDVIVDLNHAAEELFQRRRSDILGRSASELIVPAASQGQPPVEPAPLVTGMVANQLLSRRMRAHARRADGLRIEVKLRIVRAGRQEPALFTACIREISQPARTEEAVRRTEDLYQRAISGAGAVPYLYDFKSKSYVFMGDGITRLTGYGVDEMHPALWQKIMLDSVMRGEAAGLSKAEAGRLSMTGHLRNWRCDMLIRTRFGESRWISDASVLKFNEEGHPIGAAGILQDITEWKRAEQQIQDQSKLLELAHDAILIRDAEGKILYWNRGAEHLYGWKSSEAIGQSARELLNREFHVFETAEKILLSTGEWSGELRQVTREGKEVVVNSRATLMRDADGKPKSVLVINSDITEKSKLVNQLLRSQRMESIGTLAGGIAHDLNNILAPITIASQILRQKPHDEESEQMLSRIESCAQRGADVVRQVLTFARGIEGDRAPLQPRHLIKDVVKIISETFPRAINVSSHAEENLWPVTGDATQLHQVLLNLSLNARDAMPSGGELRITARNVPAGSFQGSTARPGPHVLIQVKDTGAGIPAAALEKIFEPFYTTKRLGEGTGLGLSTVLGIVKSHGGLIEVQSEPGKGAVFSVHLPATPAAATANAPCPRETSPSGDGELVLVVDDESGIRDVIKKALQKHGYRALTAKDGVEGLAIYNQHRGAIHLVITDVMMPRMEGPALVRAIKRIEPSVRVIVASGLATVPGRGDSLSGLKKLGVTDFLEKPFSSEKLLGAVRKLLAPA